MAMTKVGKYEIRGELGHGAFGKVYRAFNPTVQCPVAIKELTAGNAPDVMQRFRNEATAAGNLHHKNIVTIHDFFEEKGVPYIVMELLEGQDLQHVIKEGIHLTLLQKVQIMVQVAEGLFYAHQHNVVHRDVKPANIMLLADDSVKIMDFGIARLMGDDVTRQTMTGYVVGTPAYMCPEQIEGAEVDALADIWAYGVIYYELLSGRHPFKAPDFNATMYKIVNSEPSPLRSVAPESPEALGVIVHRALTKERSQRYQSLEDILLDTGPILVELEKEHAAGLLMESNALFAAGQLDDAESAVRRSLDLDRGNPEAQRLRRAIQDEKRRRAVRPRIESFLKSGEDAMAQRRFEEALAAFEAARRLDQSDPSIRVRVETVQSAIEQSRRAAALLAEAQSVLEGMNLTAAYRLATEAARVDPQNADAGQLVQSIQAAIEQRETERRIQEVVDKARGLMMIEAYDDAVALLNELRSAHPGSQDIAALLATALEQKARRDEERRLRTAVDGVRDLLRERNFAGAVNRLEHAVEEFGQAPELIQLLSFTREQLQVQQRNEAVQQIAAEARALLADGKFNAALQTLQKGLDSWGGDTTLVVLVQTAQNAQAALERRRDIDEAVRRCQEIRAAGHLADAREFMDAAVARLGAEPVLVQLRHTLDQDWKAYQRAETLRQALQEARNFIARGQPARAITLLEKTGVEFPEAPEIAEVLSAARQSRDELEERRFVQEQLAVAAPLERAGQVSGALKTIESALERYPQSAELLSARTRLQERLRDAERQQRVAILRRQIEDQLRAGRIERGLQLADAATAEFPAEKALSELRERAQRLRRQAEVDSLIARVRDSLDRGDLDENWELPSALAGAPETAELKELKLRIEKEKAYRGGMSGAKALASQQQWKAAEQMVQKALEAKPRDEAALALLQSINLERTAEARRKSCAEGRLEAGRLVRSRDFEKALNILGDLLGRYPGEPEVERDWQAALAAREQQARDAAEQAMRQARAEGREQIRQMLARQDTGAAQQKVEALLAQFPGDAELERDRQQVAQARERQERGAGREQVRQLLSRQEFAAAQQKVEALLAQFPGDAELERDRQQVAQTRERQERDQAAQNARQERAAGREQVRQLAARLEFAAAQQKVEALLAQFPGDAELERDRQQVAQARERRERDQAAQDARRARLEGREQVRQMLARQDFDGAQQKAEGLLAEFPGDPDLERDRRQAVQGRERRLVESTGQGASRQLRAAQRIRAQDLASRQQFDDASEIIQVLLKQFPGDADLERDLQKYQVARDQRDRTAREQRARQARAEGREQARQLLAKGQCAAAVAKLEALLVEFPGDAELETDRQQAVAERDRQQSEPAALRSSQIRARGRDQIRQLMGKQDLDNALQKAEELLAQFPDDRELRRDKKLILAARELVEKEQSSKRARQVRAERRIRAQELIARQEFDEALAITTDLLQQFPGDAELQRDRQNIQGAIDKRQREVAVRQARQLLAQQDPEAAEKVQALLARFPGDAELERELQNIVTARDRQDREGAGERARQARAEGRERVRQLRELNRFDAALEILRGLDAQFPGDAELQNDRLMVAAAREQYDREMAPQRVLQERAEGRLQVQQLVAKGQFDAALGQLDTLLRQFPGDAELERDRQMLVAARDRYAGGRRVETPLPRPPASNPPEIPGEQAPELASAEESSQSFLARLRRRFGG